MTYNCLYSSVPRPAPWTARRPLVMGLIRDEAPDVAALQEVLEPQLPEIAADLPAYRSIAGESSGRSRGLERIAKLWPFALAAWIVFIVLECRLRSRRGRSSPRHSRPARIASVLVHGAFLVASIVLPAGLAFLDWYRGPLSSIGEYCPILYRPEKFRPLESGSFWLSREPEESGTSFPLMSSPRVAHWVRFARNAGGRDLFVLNLHGGHAPWHHAPTAALVLRALDEHARGADTIVLGDFNALPESELHRRLTARLADAWETARTREGAGETFYWRSGLSFMPPLRIDFVLADRSFAPAVARVRSGTRDGVFPSDHDAVIVDFD